MGNTGAALPNVREQLEAQSEGNQTARFIVLGLLSALLLFPSIRRHGLAGFDDSFFAHEAKEMVRTGDWWDVHFNGELILAHPPLFPWLVAGSFKVFGITDPAAKFPTAFLGFATILLMYFLTLEMTGHAWLSVFTLAIFFYLKGLKDGKYLTFLGMPLGLAFLTRSVIGLLALGIILAHLVLTKRFKTLRSPWLIGGMVLALALPSVWYFSQYRLHGGTFLASHLEFLNSKIQAASGMSRWSTVFNYPLTLLKYYWPRTNRLQPVSLLHTGKSSLTQDRLLSCNMQQCTG